MEIPQHPTAPDHLPVFITAPGNTDVLMAIMAIVLIASILAAGVFFFWLHSLPERMVHNKIQFDLVAVLALLSLFTHIHAFWIAALLLAFIDLPEFSFPHFSNTLGRIAGSLEKMAETRIGIDTAKPPPDPTKAELAKPVSDGPQPAAEAVEKAAHSKHAPAAGQHTSGTGKAHGGHR